jgi:hypothetical protein
MKLDPGVSVPCAKLFAEGKAHGTNKNIDGFYTKTRIQQALCKN